MKNFTAITFADVQVAPLTSAPIAFGDCTMPQVLLARTNSGNYAKLQVMIGYNLIILDMTVYTPSGGVSKTATNVTIGGTCLCSVDQAMQAPTGMPADFFWNVQSISPGAYTLFPENGATFCLYTVVEDPTMDFNLISFLDVQNAALLGSSVPGTNLDCRVLVAKTKQGNYAKLQVRADSALHILHCILYNKEGCIIKIASNIVISKGQLCDLDQAAHASVLSAADFRWLAVTTAPTVPLLVPLNGALFHVRPGFEQASFNDMRRAPYETRSVAMSALVDQVIFLRTRNGHYAKALINSRKGLISKLTIGRFKLFDQKGKVLLNLRNVGLKEWQHLIRDERFHGLADFHIEKSARSGLFLRPVNGAALSFASYFAMCKYHELLGKSRIAKALGFRGPNEFSTRPYTAWTEAEKRLLNEFLYARETNSGIPLAGPPTLINDTYISAWDGLKIYLAHVSQTLWFEANKKANWRLESLRADQLDWLLNINRLFCGGYSSLGYDFGVASNGASQWNPEFAYHFMAGRLAPGDQLETIKAMLIWCRDNLKHIVSYEDIQQPGGPFASWEDQLDYLYGNRGVPLVDRMIEPLPGRDHVTAGCGCTTAFLALVLRTVNIPVIRDQKTVFGDLSDPSVRSLHCQTRFPTVGQNLAHGDDPYNMRVKQGKYQQAIPIELLFYSDGELEALINNPAPIEGLTKEQTTRYYFERKSWGIAIQHNADGLLYQRCFDLHSGALPRLPKELGLIGYTQSEIQAVQAQADAGLATIAANDQTCDACAYYDPAW
ncbi:MAG: hypothetical protein ACK6BG_10325 [Cyanobacteriota bacterium]